MMKEFSMHILDIAQNSIVAGATKISIELKEETENNLFYFSVADNGKGMSQEFIQKVRNPFTTSRTTRKVGLGIPMLEQTCVQCGGRLDIESEVGEGTKITASMEYANIDRPPLGNMPETLYILILMNQQVTFHYYHKYDSREYVLDMAEVREVLGDLPLDELSVAGWLKENIEDGFESLYVED